jgi:hypothetical protein
LLSHWFLAICEAQEQPISVESEGVALLIDWDERELPLHSKKSRPSTRRVEDDRRFVVNRRSLERIAQLTGTTASRAHASGPANDRGKFRAASHREYHTHFTARVKQTAVVSFRASYDS